ncbi:GNAT family N-acetyltransferase [Butyrivibrio sp. FCS006]|uniref:GNAT family N-acetyltransferase n=1 Tax=Butyrivibrio sp. FCS006 TaxID=1280684 RepID=UPI0009DB8D43|nr:GNAT family N-acetyltransferase [Butyrivibrio sp. FCS006]
MHNNTSAQDGAQTSTQTGAHTDAKPYTYREMTPSDNAVVAALIRTNLKAHKLDIPGTVYYDDGLDHLSDYYCDEDHKYYVLTDNAGSVLGGVGFARFDPMPNTAELQKLYLDNSVKRRGLGYDLMTLVEEKMREAGFKTSYLETHDNLETAIHLYEKCDYTEIPRPDFVNHSAMTRFFTKAL